MESGYKCKCMRCGKETLWEESFLIGISGFDYIKYWRLCEQCATTILEVLKDGEIT